MIYLALMVLVMALCTVEGRHWLGSAGLLVAGVSLIIASVGGAALALLLALAVMLPG